MGVWAIATPLEIDSENVRKEATRLSKGFQAHLIKTASTLGYKVDNTGDLVRLTRVPETFNLKTDPPRSVWTWREGGSQLALSELKRIADLGLPVTAAKPQRPSSSDNDDAVGGGVAKVESIRAGCRFIAHAFDDAAALPEPEWKAAIDVVAFCEDGPDWVHRMSENYTRYDRQETEAKIAASLKVAPRTCQAIAKDLGFAGCRRCPYRPKIHSPITLGYKSKHLADLGSRFVYLAEPQLFVETDKNHIRLTKSAFDNKFRHLFFKASASNSFLEWHAVSKPDNESYVPGDNHLISGDMLNTWVAGGVKSEAGDWTLIKAMFDNILPVPEEQSHFIDLLAFLAQKPGKKVNHMAIVRGRQGTGKTSIAKIIEGLVGTLNVRTINGHAITGRFHAVFMECQVLVVEEASLVERREVINRMKQLITDRSQHVEEKNQPFRDARTPDFVLVLSNEHAPYPLEDGNRRAWVSTFGEEKMESEFYSQFHANLPGELPGFKAALLERDISKFNPAKEPPMTAAKLEVIESSRLDIDQQLLQWIEERRPTFEKDIVLPEQVAAALRIAGHSRVTDQRARRALQSVGAVSLRQLPRLQFGSDIWSGQPRVWAIRNHERWKGATAAELGQYLTSGHSLRSPPDGPEDVAA